MHPDRQPHHDAPGRARPWHAAWADALYGDRGFYRSHAPAQHFHTSAQGIPGGGAVLAEALVALCRRHGLTGVVDVGAGRGELLAEVRRLAPQLHLHGVDVVDAPADLPVDRWTRSPGGALLPDALRDLHGVLVVAHEWLDVVPCPVLVRDDHEVWREVAVHEDGTEVLGPVPSAPDLAWARRWLGPQVHRAEVGRPRDQAATDLVGRVRQGLVLLVDYGHTSADRPAGGTLTGYRAGRQVAPVPDGSCDLTAHVAWDSLVDHLGAPAVLTSQRAALLGLLQADGRAGDGKDGTGEDGTGEALLAPVPHGLARADPAAYLSLLARRAALGALTAVGGLGDFGWVLVVVEEPGRGRVAPDGATVPD
ncbi:SAM-dependent methyltransferase [Ornithinimicrobium sp. W1665]|uniref:SAM-dependent methyltransferase n=1 Tax=Ornithinimicrobium sp. W1665 TaxID=3416666 RepID=UPI003CE995EB